jgi:serine/threonine-protein kinase RsbW
MAAATTVRFSIPSEVRLVDLVHDTSQRMAEIAGLGADEALDVALAVREAVINAIRHGNREDEGKQVDLTLRANGTGITVRVRDRGEGFDPAAHGDPTAAENLLRASGRGILLMRAFVDQVRFKRLDGRGMEITLVKKIRSGRSERPAD